MTEDIQKAEQQITVTLATGEKVKAGVNIRPHAKDCLEALAQHFELIVFTASHPFYAEHVIKILDPKGTLFAHRLFRTNCIQTEGQLYIKDLRVLDRDLKKVVIVDNSIHSFAFQLDNGIPIIPFYDDKDDNILPKIRDYMVGIKNNADFRVANRPTFSLKELYDLNVPSFLKYYVDNESDDDVSGDSFDEISCEGSDEEGPVAAAAAVATAMDEDRLVDLRRKSMPLIKMGNLFGVFPKIGKKARAEVESELGKLRDSLPKYLATEVVAKSVNL